MARALPPALALAFLRELAWDLRWAQLRAPDGDAVVGDPATAPTSLTVRDGEAELSVAPGPHALEALVRHDAALALAAAVRRGGRR